MKAKEIVKTINTHDQNDIPREGKVTHHTAKYPTHFLFIIVTPCLLSICIDVEISSPVFHV
jgi:hypothetical protein